MKYEVMWDYRSSLGGPWVKGQVVEMSPEMAEAITRDSPGVLRLHSQDEQDARDNQDSLFGRMEGGKMDRMVKAAGYSRKAKVRR
jgi:hypothetical protein